MRRSVRTLCLCLLAAVSLSATGCWRGRRWWWRHHSAGPVVVNPPGPATVIPLPETLLVSGQAMKGDAR
ncbi:MAG TPA: hypothetical protein VNE39_26210 [Planctomycetota bacterium]|nr:hypothetical protein [Planctomycetota bacterium]